MEQEQKLETIQLASQKTASFHWMRGIIFFVGIFLVLGFATVSVFKAQQQHKQYQTQLEQAKAAQEIAVKQNRELFQATQQMKDPHYLEEVARRDYYYTKPGEVIFELGSDAKTVE